MEEFVRQAEEKDIPRSLRDRLEFSTKGNRLSSRQRRDIKDSRDRPLTLVYKTRLLYKEMMQQRDNHPQDPNHENVIDISRDEDDGQDEIML
ncbi:uncharacterized protein KY384_005673 [Bacidia gigantensis]|uniref:uncharacterized protein n=1 Tax=Bacidia gigantensis TaxID=2732470 RepID=UPI001D03E3F3|nr:uncharacterized protein KY384_005673 [Bacidia gigantensis]KAG8529039.1 hypothetical protein KY384_005673 [Bacidia gigantensis]